MAARFHLSDTPLDPTTLAELLDAQDLHEVEALLQELAATSPERNGETVDASEYANNASYIPPADADMLQFYFRDIRPISEPIPADREQALAKLVQAANEATERLNSENSDETRDALEEVIDG